MQRIVHSLSEDLKNALIAYHTATNPIRPDCATRDAVLEYLSAGRVSRSMVRRLGISTPVVNSNALAMLGVMALLFRHLGYRGICILFDEAEAIHSFSRGDHQEVAYANLHRMIAENHTFPHCYFVYATTPTFFDSYSRYWPHNALIKANEILELEPLGGDEWKLLGRRIMAVYERAYEWHSPSSLTHALDKALLGNQPHRVGDYVRQIVAVLDESRGA